MPCAMSSLRGASGVVGCDRVVCPPCAPRYYYSTPRCTLVYSLVLSSVCCASVWCCAPVLWCALCLACPACGVAAWCCGCGVWVRCVLPPALPAPVGVCYGVPCTPCTFPVFFLGIIPALYMGCYMWALYAPYIRALFLGLLFMIRSVHTVKAGPWILNVDFQKSA